MRAGLHRTVSPRSSSDDTVQPFIAGNGAKSGLIPRCRSDVILASRHPTSGRHAAVAQAKLVRHLDLRTVVIDRLFAIAPDWAGSIGLRGWMIAAMAMRFRMEATTPAPPLSVDGMSIGDHIFIFTIELGVGRSRKSEPNAATIGTTSAKVAQNPHISCAMAHLHTGSAICRKKG